MPQQNLQAEDFTSEKNPEELSHLLNALAITLCKKFNEYSGHRYDKENEWLRAIEQNEGKIDSQDIDKLKAALGKDYDRANSVNITRPKTNVVVSRLQDTQFPIGGDYNFNIKPRPATEEVQAALQAPEASMEMQVMAAEAGMQPDQAPAPQEVAQEIVDADQEAARLMKLRVQKDLVAADYGNKARRALEDLGVLGTAIIKGPFAEYKSHTGYTYDEETEDWLPVVRKTIQPGVTRVDPLYWYPDPTAREPNEVEDSFEVHLWSRTQLIEAAKSGPYMQEQVEKVLDWKDGNLGDVPAVINTASFLNSGISLSNRFVVHEYHGNLPKDVLYEAGLISEEEKESSTTEIYGYAWFVDRFLIRLSLPLIEGAPDSQYKVTTYERDPESVFGHGVPYLLRHSQRIINNTYLMLMDNASLTSGPQIVLNKEMIQPAGRTNDYTMRPMKTWHLTEYGADVREAMQFVNVPANSDGLMGIIDMAMRFADIESSVPMMQQGEMPVGNNTSMGGLAMVASALSIVQKRASLRWDDYVTKPLIEGYYHFNMQYSDDAKIKADLQVEIGGATERLDSQMRGQDIERIMGLAQSDPNWADQIDEIKAFRELVGNSHAGDILRDAEEAQQLVEQRRAQEQQAAQSDPEGMKAQAAMLNAETGRMELEARVADMQQKRQIEVATKQAELDIRQREIEARNNGNMVELQKSREAFELKMAELAVQRDTNVQQLQKDLQLKAMDERTQRAKIEKELLMQQREIEIKQEFGEGL